MANRRAKAGILEGTTPIASRPPSRVGTKLIAAHVSRSTWLVLTSLAKDLDSSIQACLVEAVEDFIAKPRSDDTRPLPATDPAFTEDQAVADAKMLSDAAHRVQMMKERRKKSRDDALFASKTSRHKPR